MQADVERLLHDPDLEVRTEALLYLAAARQRRSARAIESLGDFEDFSIRAAMVAFLARPGPTENVDAARLMLGGDGPRRRRADAPRGGAA